MMKRKIQEESDDENDKEDDKKHVKIKRSGLHLFYFSFSFLFFSLDLLFIFQFLEQLGLGSEVINHTVTSVTI